MRRLELAAEAILGKVDSGIFMPTFSEWLPEVSPEFTWDWKHLAYLQTQLQRVADGDLKRLMVFMPPRHGKSEMTTIRFPAWWLERNPKAHVMVCAYGQTLANKFSRKIRNIARERIAINSERRAVDEWETDAGGGCRAAGVGGGITGMGGDLIIIDDPVKSRKEASSLTSRNSNYEWYTHDLLTRVEPGAAIIVIQTRWHEDDLSGRILANEPDDWEVVSLPALAEFDDDILGRKIGDALCPERFTTDELLRVKGILGRGFAALYQQRPVEQEGGYFKRSWFSLADDLPHHPEHGYKRYKFIRFWDKAATIDGDYTAGTLMALDLDLSTYYVVDVVREKLSTHERDQLILRTAYKDRDYYGNVGIRHEQEPGSSGIDAAKATTAMLAGFSVKAIRATGSKSLRAEPFQAQVEGGNVLVVKGKWNPEYIEELCSFPSGKHDDMVDASSGAFNELTKGRAFIITPNSSGQKRETVVESSMDNLTAVFTYGRFQPPHLGHLEIVKKMQSFKGDKLLFASMSQNSTDNPLTYAFKIALLKNAFGEQLKVVPNFGKIVQILQFLQRDYDHINLVVGADRFSSFSNLIANGNGKYFSFKTAIVTAVERKDGAISATKLRKMVRDGEREQFCSFIPNNLGDEVYVKLQRSL